MSEKISLDSSDLENNIMQCKNEETLREKQESPTLK